MNRIQRREDNTTAPPIPTPRTTGDFSSSCSSCRKGLLFCQETAFADFWGRLAGIYRTNRLVIFGLMNEPNAIPASQWIGAANGAIAAIRAAGATNLILVPGIDWTGARGWTSSGNATAMLGIVDSGHHHAFEVHQYLDAGSSGISANIVHAGIGATRVAGFTQWLRTNGSGLSARVGFAPGPGPRFHRVHVTRNP